MKILFITDNFYPEKNAPAIRTYEHCLNWANKGYQITILTSNPNFPKGKIFKGYKNKLLQFEKIEKIKVIRIWTFVSANQGFFLRVLDQLSFAISAIIASMFIKNNDVIIGTSPHFFTVIATYIISFLKRKPWVFELRDLWPDSIVELGFLKKESYAFKFLKKIEIFLYKKANIIIPVTHSFRKYLINQKIDKKKIKVITNGVNLNLMFPIKRDISLFNKYNLKNKLSLGYVGTHGKAHNLDTIINVAKKLKDDGYEDKIIFFFIGDGSEKENLINLKKRLKLKNVKFIDILDRVRLKNYWSILDISLIHLKKIDLFKDVIPSKIFDSIGMNVPILLGVNGESKKILNKYKLGEFFEPEDEIQLYNKILKFNSNKKLLKQYSKNAILATYIYDRNFLSSKMISFIKNNI